MIEIDGSQKSGSGTILRLSVALSAITQNPLHIFNIRHNRPKPGLKPQHLEAVKTAAKLCNAEIKGAKLYSRELWFEPNKSKGGTILSEIGTAGSISQLIMTVLPICIFSNKSTKLIITKGGTDVLNSPTINFMKFVFLKTLKKMGVKASIKINSYGYYPKGMGEVILNVSPSKPINSINLVKFGKIISIKGISVSTFLRRKKVAERQAYAAMAYLKEKGYDLKIRILYDQSNPFQKGSSITLWTKTENGILIGADAIGAVRKTSEKVGIEVAKKMYDDLQLKPTVDVNLSDMLIPYMALTKGVSTFLTRKITDHLATNMWLMEKILDVRFKTRKLENLYRITKYD